MKRYVTKGIVVLFIITCIFFSFNNIYVNSYDNLDLSKEDITRKKGPPKVQSRLYQIIQANNVSYTPEELEEDHRVEKIRVIIELGEFNETSLSTLSEKGASIERIRNNLIQATIYPQDILELSKEDNIQYIRMPYLAYPEKTSEGASVINADYLNEVDINGDGIKIAILDLGFEGYTSLLGTELPSNPIINSFHSEGIEAGEDHGTACAEIAYDLAPDAQYYFVNFQTSLDLADAVDWLIQEQVDIISFSVGYYNAGPGDGTGPICDIVNNAADNGVLWVGAAGNDAEKHYQAVFSDPDSDGYHNVDGSIETIPITADAGQYLRLYLNWFTSWPTTEDYDLYLYDSALNLVAYSDDVQTSGMNPVESIYYYVSYTDTYHVVIKDWSTTSSHTLELFSSYTFDKYQVAEGSLTIPGDAAGSFTVGATAWQDDTLHYYSSQGPTTDGRIKPDITAPSGVTTSTLDPFSGTSASAPHVAGAAALLLQDKTLTTDQLREAFENTAVELGPPGKDNSYGSGRIDVKQARIYHNNLPTSTLLSPVSGQFTDNISLSGQSEDTDGNVQEMEFEYNLLASDPLDPGWSSIGVDSNGDDGWSIEWTTSEYTTNLAYVRARAYDGLEYGDWDTNDNPLTIDNTPPNQPTLTETICGSTWTTENTPSYEWSDPGDIGTSVQYYQGQLDSEPVITVTSPYQPILDDGEHSYKVRAFDQLDNVGEWSNTITVQIDTTGPTGSITINNDDPSTTSRDVTLSCTGIDAGSGLQDMSFRNENGDWSTPEGFTSAKSWQLSEDIGEKTVYIRLRDNLGTETIFSDTIQLEEEPPTFTLNLDAGWNLVSFPVSLDDPSVANVLTGISSYVVKAWSGTEYIIPTVFEPGKAYWIKVDSEASIDLFGLEVETVNLELEPGYNLIGGPISSVEASSVLSGYYVVATWGENGYISSSSFEPGTGYLVLVTTTKSVTLP